MTGWGPDIWSNSSQVNILGSASALESPPRNSNTNISFGMFQAATDEKCELLKQLTQFKNFKVGQMKMCYTRLFSQVRRGVPSAPERPGSQTGGLLAHHTCGNCPVGCTRALQSRVRWVLEQGLFQVIHRSSSIVPNKEACLLQVQETEAGRSWVAPEEPI